ncbi:hypothetical protein ACP70R_047919 [Stipagrostis hirtigluma subsp. patula]
MTTSAGSSTLSASSAALNGSANASPALIFINPFATVAESHVPMTFEMERSNYVKWSAFFTSMCGKFSLMEHINGSPACPNDVAWVQAQCCFLS